MKYTSVLGLELSGTLGGSVTASRWKGRNYFRQWVKPTNPRTPRQMIVRGAFASAVARWRDQFHVLQRQAYDPLTAGLAMSGYNLFISRWQRMTPAQRSAFVSPFMGFKQFGAGAMSAVQNVSTVANQTQYSAGALPHVITEYGFTQGAGNFNPVAVIENERGRIRMLQALTGAFTVSYVSGGRTIIDEPVKTNPAVGEIFHTRFFPVVDGSVMFRLAGTNQHTLEANAISRIFRVSNPATYTAGGTIHYRNYTPVPDARYELRRAGTAFVTHRGFADANGLIRLAQTAEDGTRDSVIDAVGMQRRVLANISAEQAARDEYIGLLGA